MLSILKRSDADALICLTPAPAPNELAQRLSQGHPFHVTAVVTFPDAHWARDLAAHLAEERVGGADSSWYAVSPSDAILKILELWGANPDEQPREAPAKRARGPCQTAKKGTSGVTTDSSTPSLEPPAPTDSAAETESVASGTECALDYLEACGAALAPKAADLRAELQELHGAALTAAIMAQCTQNSQLDAGGKRRRIVRFGGLPMQLRAPTGNGL